MGSSLFHSSAKGRKKRKRREGGQNDGWGGPPSAAAAAAAAGQRFDDDGQALSFLPKKGAIYSLAEQIDASDDRSALPRRTYFFARKLFCGLSDFFKHPAAVFRDASLAVRLIAPFSQAAE